MSSSIVHTFSISNAIGDAKLNDVIIEQLSKRWNTEILTISLAYFYEFALFILARTNILGHYFFP